MARLERLLLFFLAFFWIFIILRQTHFFPRTRLSLHPSSSFYSFFPDWFSSFSSLGTHSQAHSRSLRYLYTHTHTHAGTHAYTRIHISTHWIRHAITFVVNSLRSGVNLMWVPGTVRVRSFAKSCHFPDFASLCPEIKIGACLTEGPSFPVKREYAGKSSYTARCDYGNEDRQEGGNAMS